MKRIACLGASGVLLGVWAVLEANAQVVYVRAHPFRWDSAGDYFGCSVSGAGDVNNDGFDDFIVGAPNDVNTGTDSGSARVISGRTGGVLYAFNGDSAGDRFGFSVSGAGDVNNDGFADLIVGAPIDDNNGSNSGSARVFSGRSGAILYTFNGDLGNEQFGFSVSGAGDVDNDGFDDLIVGAAGEDDNGLNSGRASVFSGRTGLLLATFKGDSQEGFFGQAVGGAGDVDPDGIDDLIIGAVGDDANGTDSGSATLIYSDVPFSWGRDVPDCPGDADGSGVVNFADITNVILNFNNVCP